MSEPTIDFEELRRLAQAATPGPWRCNHHHKSEVTYLAPDGDPILFPGEEVAVANDISPRDAEFIAAANPAAILALLDTLDRVAAVADEADRVAVFGGPGHEIDADYATAIRQALGRPTTNKFTAEEIDRFNAAVPMEPAG